MGQYLIRVLLTSVLVVMASEVSKRDSSMGALLASLPLTSLLAMGWLYWGTRDVERVARLSTDIFWLVLPSLILFLSLPWMLRHRWNFFTALAASTMVMTGCYTLAMWAVRRWGGR